MVSDPRYGHAILTRPTRLQSRSRPATPGSIRRRSFSMSFHSAASSRAVWARSTVPRPWITTWRRNPWLWRGGRTRAKEGVNEFAKGYSPPHRGGVAAPSKKRCEASFEGADGAVSRAQCFENQHLSERPPPLRRFGAFAYFS